MKRIIMLALLMLLACTLQAQNTYKVGENGQLISTKATVNSTVTKTVYTLTIKDKVYPVYKSARSKYFIIRTSKNTGKEYKMYIKLESNSKVSKSE